MKLFLNTARAATENLTVSVEDVTSKALPSLFFGDKLPLQVTVHNGQGQIDANYQAAVLTVAVGILTTQNRFFEQTVTASNAAANFTLDLSGADFDAQTLGLESTALTLEVQAVRDTGDMVQLPDVAYGIGSKVVLLQNFSTAVVGEIMEIVEMVYNPNQDVTHPKFRQANGNEFFSQPAVDGFGRGAWWQIVDIEQNSHTIHQSSVTVRNQMLNQQTVALDFPAAPSNVVIEKLPVPETPSNVVLDISPAAPSNVIVARDAAAPSLVQPAKMLDWNYNGTTVQVPEAYEFNATGQFAGLDTKKFVWDGVTLKNNAPVWECIGNSCGTSSYSPYIEQIYAQNVYSTEIVWRLYYYAVSGSFAGGNTNLGFNGSTLPHNLFNFTGYKYTSGSSTVEFVPSSYLTAAPNDPSNVVVSTSPAAPTGFTFQIGDKFNILREPQHPDHQHMQPSLNPWTVTSLVGDDGLFSIQSGSVTGYLRPSWGDNNPEMPNPFFDATPITDDDGVQTLTEPAAPSSVLPSVVDLTTDLVAGQKVIAITQMHLAPADSGNFCSVGDIFTITNIVEGAAYGVHVERDSDGATSSLAPSSSQGQSGKVRGVNWNLLLTNASFDDVTVKISGFSNELDGYYSRLSNELGYYKQDSNDVWQWRTAGSMGGYTYKKFSKLDCDTDLLNPVYFYKAIFEGSDYLITKWRFTYKLGKAISINNNALDHSMANLTTHNDTQPFGSYSNNGVTIEEVTSNPCE